MSTDPKKFDEIKDKELEMVSGGAGPDIKDENPDDGDGSTPRPPHTKPGKMGREKA